MMNFNKFGLSAAVMVSAMAGTVATAVPAHALNLAFAGGAQFNQTTGQFDFFGGSTPGTGTALVTPTTSSSVAAVGSFITLQDLQLTTSGTIRSLASTPLTSFISGLKDGQTFDLQTFDFNVDTQKAIIAGFFRPSDESGPGTLTTQELVFEDGSSYSVQIVPTPAAVLPGLLGMGAAAFRKKKQEDAGEVTPETAEANT